MTFPLRATAIGLGCIIFSLGLTFIARIFSTQPELPWPLIRAIAIFGVALCCVALLVTVTREVFCVRD